MRLKILSSTNDEVTAVHVHTTEVLKGHTISSVVEVCDGAVPNDDDDDPDDNDNSTDTKPVHVTIVFGGLTFHHQVAPESCVRSLKQGLMDNRQVCLPLVEYELVMRNNVATPNQYAVASQKDVIPLGKDGVVLEDDAMALQFYGVRDGAVLHVERNYLGIIVQNQKGQEVWVMVPKMATVGELKHAIMEAASLHCARTFSLFTTVRVETRNGNDVINFNKLAEGNDVIVGHVLRDRDKLFMIENKFCDSPRNLIQESGLQVYGMEVGDTALSVRLRAQDQLGISAAHFRVERVFFRNPSRLPVLCPEQHCLKPTALYRVTCRFTPVTHGFQFQPYLGELTKVKSPRESNTSPEKVAKGTLTGHSFPTGTPGHSAGVNITTPAVITEMPSSTHAVHQALSVTFRSSPGSHRNGAWVNETGLGEITNIPMVSAIQAVHNLFGGSALGTPVFGGRDSSQACILDTGKSPQIHYNPQGRDQSEVDSTYPGAQDSTKSTIFQQEEDTNPDTTPKIVEDKSESTPNSENDQPHNIKEHTSESLSIKEDSSKHEQETPSTKEYKADPPNSENDTSKPPSFDQSSSKFREDLLESASSTEAENLLKAGKTQQESTTEDKLEENRQNTERDKVQSATDCKDQSQAITDKAQTPLITEETDTETPSNTEEDKPEYLPTTVEGKIVSQPRTRETKLESPSIKSESPTCMGDYNPDTPPNVKKNKPEAPNTEEVKPEYLSTILEGKIVSKPRTRETKLESPSIKSESPTCMGDYNPDTPPNVKKNKPEAPNTEEVKPEYLSTILEGKIVSQPRTRETQLESPPIESPPIESESPTCMGDDNPDTPPNVDEDKPKVPNVNKNKFEAPNIEEDKPDASNTEDDKP